MTEGAGAPVANRVLAIENRRRIYDCIKRTPGTHLRGIQRELAMPYGTAEYHLHALEDAGLVRATSDGNLKRYFAADFSFEDRAVLGLLRKRPIRAIVIALLAKQEMAHQDLAAAAGVKPPTLSYHLVRLEGAKVVEVRRDGRYALVRLHDPNLMERLLITHGRSFGDAAVDRFLETWGGFGAPAPLPEGDPSWAGDSVWPQGTPPSALLPRRPAPNGEE